MARFDKNAPYDIVGGLPGAAFIQNGRMFNQGGAEVETYREGEGDDARTMARVKSHANPNLTVEDELELSLEAAIEAPAEPAALHWRHLKALVESYGHVWRDRQTALRFLENREDEPHDAPVSAEENVE